MPAERDHRPGSAIVGLGGHQQRDEATGTEQPGTEVQGGDRSVLEAEDATARRAGQRAARRSRQWGRGLRPRLEPLGLVVLGSVPGRARVGSTLPDGRHVRAHHARAERGCRGGPSTWSGIWAPPSCGWGPGMYAGATTSGRSKSLPHQRAQRPVELDEPAAVGAHTPQAIAAGGTDRSIPPPPPASSSRSGGGTRSRRAIASSASARSLDLGDRLAWPDDAIEQDREQEQEGREGDDEARRQVGCDRIGGPVLHVPECPEGRQQPHEHDVDGDGLQPELHVLVRQDRVDRIPERLLDITEHGLDASAAERALAIAQNHPMAAPECIRGDRCGRAGRARVPVSRP